MTLISDIPITEKERVYEFALYCLRHLYPLQGKQPRMQAWRCDDEPLIWCSVFSLNQSLTRTIDVRDLRGKTASEILAFCRTVGEGMQQEFREKFPIADGEK